MHSRALVFVTLILFSKNLDAKLLCLTKLQDGFRSLFPKKVEHEPEIAIPVKIQTPQIPNHYNWKSVMDRVKGRDEARAKFEKSLEVYDGTQGKEFHELINFLSSEEGKGWSVNVVNGHGSSVCSPKEKRVVIYMGEQNEDGVAYKGSDGKIYYDTPAHTFVHELWHAKDIEEKHPASAATNSDIFENPINQLNREFRANFAAYNGNLEAAWHITESRYDSRIRNAEEFIPELKKLDYSQKTKLLEKLVQIQNTDPSTAQNIHATWWKNKYANSWNAEERTRYIPDPNFNLRKLIQDLMN